MVAAVTIQLQREGVPLPAALGMLSPWADPDPNMMFDTQYTLIAVDPIILPANSGSGNIAVAYVGGNQDVFTDPLVSPRRADWVQLFPKGTLPPTLIQVRALGLHKLPACCAAEDCEHYYYVVYAIYFSEAYCVATVHSTVCMFSTGQPQQCAHPGTALLHARKLAWFLSLHRILACSVQHSDAAIRCCLQRRQDSSLEGNAVSHIAQALNSLSTHRPYAYVTCHTVFLFQVGLRESLLSQCVQLYHNLKKAAPAPGHVSISPYDGMWHVFQSFFTLPEAEAAHQEMADFFTRAINGTICKG